MGGRGRSHQEQQDQQESETDSSWKYQAGVRNTGDMRYALGRQLSCSKEDAVRETNELKTVSEDGRIRCSEIIYKEFEN